MDDLLYANKTTTLYRLIGRDIVRGGFADEPFPNEGQMSLRYGVSRTVVREAVKVLMAKGLVRTQPRLGVEIEPFETWDLFDAEIVDWMLTGRRNRDAHQALFRLQQAIEPTAAAMAADNPPAGRLASLIATLQREGTGQGLLRTTILGIHMAVIDASRNMYFIRLKPVIRASLTRLLDPLGIPPGELITPYAGLHACISGGDSAGADSAMRALLEIYDKAL